MRKILLYLPIFLIQFCSPSNPTRNTSDQIKKVETSLVADVYFEDEPTWTIEERMKHYHVPGVSIAVIDNFKIAWTKAYGVMDEETNEPVTTQTLFQAGSISKPVAAYGALKLVEEGKINMDEDVNTYLKSWKLPENEFNQNRKIALKHLLSHTGGVTVHGFLGYSPDLPVPTLVQVLNGEKPANSPPIRVDKVPEESFRYSGGGYCIMQQMLIDIEGKEFPIILNEKVLQPLGMTNSTYNQPLNPEQLKMAATGYLPDGTMTKGKRHTYPEMAAAGLWTTAEDLAKFAIDVQKTYKGESSTILSKEMVNRMLTPFVEDFIGLGIFLSDYDDEIYFGHGGWDEGFSSKMGGHKTKGYGVVILTNSNHPEFIDELSRAVALTYRWDNYVSVFKKRKMDTTQFTTIRGRYKNGNDDLITIETDGNKLFRKNIRSEATELFQVSDSTYVSHTSDQVLQFKLNPSDGRLHILVGNTRGDAQKFEHPKLTENEKIPFEFLLAGDFEKAIGEYQSLMRANPKDLP